MKFHDGPPSSDYPRLRPPSSPSSAAGPYIIQADELRFKGTQPVSSRSWLTELSNPLGNLDCSTQTLQNSPLFDIPHDLLLLVFQSIPSYDFLVPERYGPDSTRNSFLRSCKFCYQLYSPFFVWTDVHQLVQDLPGYVHLS